MIDVRLRHLNDTKAVHLMTWPAEHIDRVLPLISGWGINDQDSGDEYTDLTGQFVVKSGEAYFEITYGEDTE